MDKFREHQFSQCSIGGIKCPCCNPWTGKNKSAKRRLNQIARSKLKREDEKYFGESIDNRDQL